MIRSFCLFVLLAAACSPETAAGNDGDADRTGPSVAAPANEQAQTPETILGAIDGPCGSTRVDEFLGKPWTEEIAAVMREKSGASDVKPFKPNDVYDQATKLDELRLNVYLSPSGRIVHLVCG